MAELFLLSAGSHSLEVRRPQKVIPLAADQNPAETPGVSTGQKGLRQHLVLAHGALDRVLLQLFQFRIRPI
ncbi:hypothetical protein U8P76_30680 (plasmid) [Rhizobium johnstonii]|nr:hypothetical protein U8P76_30680 [Rhizobium johnstonii]